MELDHYLTQMALLGCDGETSHTLILALDGSVEIRFRDGRRANVDVRNGINLTHSVVLPNTLLQEAIAFGRTCLR